MQVPVTLPSNLKGDFGPVDNAYTVRVVHKISKRGGRHRRVLLLREDGYTYLTELDGVVRRRLKTNDISEIRKHGTDYCINVSNVDIPSLVIGDISDAPENNNMPDILSVIKQLASNVLITDIPTLQELLRGSRLKPGKSYKSPRQVLQATGGFSELRSPTATASEFSTAASMNPEKVHKIANENVRLQAEIQSLRNKLSEQNLSEALNENKNLHRILRSDDIQQPDSDTIVKGVTALKVENDYLRQKLARRDTSTPSNVKHGTSFNDGEAVDVNIQNDAMRRQLAHRQSPPLEESLDDCRRQQQPVPLVMYPSSVELQGKSDLHLRKSPTPNSYSEGLDELGGYDDLQKENNNLRWQLANRKSPKMTPSNIHELQQAALNMPDSPRYMYVPKPENTTAITELQNLTADLQQELTLLKSSKKNDRKRIRRKRAAVLRTQLSDAKNSLFQIFDRLNTFETRNNNLFRNTSQFSTATELVQSCINSTP